MLVESGAGGSLNVNANITTARGIITIQNKDGTNGTISIGTGTLPITIATGSPPGSIGGIVSIFTGKMASSTNSSVAHTGLTIAASGRGKVFLGANPSALIFDGANFANAINRNVILSAGSSASSITLNGQVTLTADPPASLVPVSNMVPEDGEVIVDTNETEFDELIVESYRH